MVMVKSIMKDESKSLFKGIIKIRKDAKTSEAYLAGHAILLNKGSHSDAIPGLEIETNRSGPPILHLFLKLMRNRYFI